MRVMVLGSGSTGNTLLLESAGERVVLDAGINPTQMATRMHAIGADLYGMHVGSAETRARGQQAGVVAIVVTHHHGDHICRARPLHRAFKAPLYLHDGIHYPSLRNKAVCAKYEPGTAFTVGPFTIEAMWIPHDAPQVALRVTSNGVTFGMATDLGHVPSGLVEFLGECDVALVEANYCPELLRDGPYPWTLKRRVASEVGHLSNQQTAELARRLASTKLSRLYLGHLSRSNNTPERALSVVAGAAGPLPVEVIEHGEVRKLDTTFRPRPRRACQLQFAFGAA